MSTITVPNLQIGDTISSKPINTFISTVNGFSATADSFKPEGIDRRNIQPQVTHDYRYWRDDPTSPYEVSSNFFTKVNNGSQDIEIGPVTVPAGQAFHVCASFNFYGEVAATRSGSFGRDQFTFKIGYDVTNANGTSSGSYLPKSFGVVGYSAVGAPDKFIVNANCCTLELMQNTTTIENIYTFYVLAKSKTFGQALPNKILIDSFSLFYVRYLV